MDRRKKALRIARKLRDAGQHETASRLVEAFQLDSDFSSKKNLDIDPEAVADIDDQEMADTIRDLDRYIPTAATLPDDLDDEQSINIDTGIFPRRKR